MQCYFYQDQKLRFEKTKHLVFFYKNLHTKCTFAPNEIPVIFYSDEIFGSNFLHWNNEGMNWVCRENFICGAICIMTKI